MPFRINNNPTAITSLRHLQRNQNLMNKLVERLSSGSRITSAADDAAGLAASSRMRAEIAALETASRNTAQAGSMTQVAEGGMAQIGDMLVRLKELGTQAASGNASANAEVIQNEADAIMAEIDRVAGATTYDGTSLLNGSAGTVEIQVGDTGGAESKMEVAFGDVTTGKGYLGERFLVAGCIDNDDIDQHYTIVGNSRCIQWRGYFHRQNK